MLKKYGIWVIIFITAIGIIMTISLYKKEAVSKEIGEYRAYLQTLDADGVIKEHFKNKNEKNIHKLNETVANKYKDIDWGQNNLEQIKVLEISINHEATKVFIEYLRNNDEDFVDAKVFDVTYDVKYKESGPQDSGRYTWRYNMIKKNDETAWLIESFGF